MLQLLTEEIGNSVTFAVPEFSVALEGHGRLGTCESERALVLSVSAATIDRLRVSADTL